ncbi:hypothetical protein JB92DRAFT_2829382 [Gautieria morchelliformis]|nr:hypothetical protein JB92DRAFT_2829382 [Gautieria morchelliformis]
MTSPSKMIFTWTLDWWFQECKGQCVLARIRRDLPQAKSVIIATLCPPLTGTTRVCYSYGCWVKNAFKDKERLIDQLFGLQSVLEHARRLVDDETKNVFRFDNHRQLGAEGSQGEAGQGPWSQMPHDHAAKTSQSIERTNWNIETIFERCIIGWRFLPYQH